ncbi:hypothetical protein [Fibrobacter sp. UWB7]|uniref:hypothetical protein n=1 Tax=Fibrobacter sp. UWB7 TaxID=1896206 RepID=UPI0009100201|nr:hypothetical protein [Fibrobacter sp. UWB7]SHM53023.1 hypothetical protein SAMN05720467_1631 [Fibrobacter sp. UWB7]
MNYKKIGVGLSLSMAMGFMACGDDSSSPIAASDTPDKQVSSSSVESSPNSSSDVASSSSAAEEPSSSSVKEADPCGFAATDDVWTISYKGSDGKNNANITTTYEIKGEDLVIRDSIRYTGSMTSMMCNIDPTSSNKSSDGAFVGERSCDEDGNTVIYVSSTTEKGYFANRTREDAFKAVRNDCKAAIGEARYAKITIVPETKCDFTMDDAEWSYFYKDEDLKGDTVPKKKLVFLDPEDGRYVNMNYSIYPMPHLECVSKNFADFSGIHYCSADAYFNIASSSTSFDKATLFEIEQKACKEFLPAESNTTEEPENKETGETPAGDMVSCDIPGVLGECLEFPAGSDEAIAMTAQCESVLEGTLGTGCAK